MYLLLSFLSLFPFLVFLGLLFLRKSALWVAAIGTLAATLAVTIAWWRIEWLYVFNSLAKAGLIAADIAVIIIGAIFFLEILQRTETLKNVGYYLESFAKDYRVQIIVLAWLFENFIEGTAGFGAPAAVVAPILISLGLPALPAVVLSLLGNSTSSAFGAAGTPIRVGLAAVEAPGAAMYASIFNLIGLIVPLFMLWLLTAGQADRGKQFREAAPFALWAGLVYVTGALGGVFVGVEFPTIVGALVGLAAVYLTTRWGLFLPRTTRRLRGGEIRQATMPLIKVAAPYVLLIAFLIGGKYVLGAVEVQLAAGLRHKINFYNPGLAFMAAGLPVALFWLKEKRQLGTAFTSALKRTVQPWLVIASMSAVVQLLIFSGENMTGYPSAIEIMAGYFSNGWLPFLAPMAGAFGSFLTGSATLSNVMFGNFLSLASEAIGANAGLILGLSLTGAAAGNMVALADVLAAETVVGLKNEERAVIKGVLPACLVYVLLTGLSGMVAVYWF